MFPNPSGKGGKMLFVYVKNPHAIWEFRSIVFESSEAPTLKSRKKTRGKKRFETSRQGALPVPSSLPIPPYGYGRASDMPPRLLSDRWQHFTKRDSSGSISFTPPISQMWK